MKNFTSFLDPMCPRVSTEESEVMNIFANKQIKVAGINDAYPSVTCDCCEQLKLPNEVKLLGYFSKQKGFNNHMTQILQEKTYKYVPKEERDYLRMSIDRMEYFLEIFKLCENCAEKILSIKENLGSGGNNLNV